MDYQEKYLKYKLKYLRLKEQIGGDRLQDIINSLTPKQLHDLNINIKSINTTIEDYQKLSANNKIVSTPINNDYYLNNNYYLSIPNFNKKITRMILNLNNINTDLLLLYDIFTLHRPELLYSKNPLIYDITKLKTLPLAQKTIK